MISVETIERSTYFTENHQQPLHVGSVGYGLDIHTLQQKMCNYLHNLSSLATKILSLNSPQSAPLVFAKFTAGMTQSALFEGELAHKDAIQCHSQT